MLLRTPRLDPPINRSGARLHGPPNAIETVIGDRVPLVARTMAARASGAMVKWRMLVANVFKIMDLLRLQEHGGGERVDRGIAPSLKMKATQPVEVLEILPIHVAPEEVKVRNFEIRPEVAHGPAIAFAVL